MNEELSQEEVTTEQVRKVPNPTGKGGFGDHPENRNDGGRIKNPLKEFSRLEFESWDTEKKREYLDKVSAIDRWKMTEGNPDSDIDLKFDENTPLNVIIRKWD